MAKILYGTKQVAVDTLNPAPNEQISSGDANEIRNVVNFNDTQLIELKGDSTKTIPQLDEGIQLNTAAIAEILEFGAVPPTLDYVEPINGIVLI